MLVKPFYVITTFSVDLKQSEMKVLFTGLSILNYESIFVCKVRNFLIFLKKIALVMFSISTRHVFYVSFVHCSRVSVNVKKLF